jgi:hypothetical protein
MAEELRLTTRLFQQALFYASTVILGILLALSELDQGRVDNFLRFGGIVLAVLAVELYLGWAGHSRHSQQIKIPHIDQVSNQSKFLHHMLLPLITYLSIIGFAYFNRQAHLRFPILLIALFIFTILFINIRAYYSHTIKVLESTHFIYDIIKLIIFFCASDSLLHMTQAYDLGILGPLGIAALSIGLMLLMIVRYERMELVALLLVVGLSLAIGALAYFLILQGRFNPIQMSLLTFLSFYISSAALHHEMDHNLTATILIEYAAILVIAISLVYGING